MHPLDERVLRHDEPAAQVRGVVLDRPSEAEAIEFGAGGRTHRAARASSSAARSRPISATARMTATPYLNSPESPVFIKRLLYGLSDARDAIRKKERVVLVEGHFDHLALIAAGVEETVASQGTALTPEQAERPRRLAPEVIVCYDGDDAGREATRARHWACCSGRLSAPGSRAFRGCDPHDVLSNEGAEALAARIDDAPDAVSWLLEDLAPTQKDLPPAEKTDRIHKILEPLRQIPDAILRYEEFRRVSRHVGVPLRCSGRGRRGSAPLPPRRRRPPPPPRRGLPHPCRARVEADRGPLPRRLRFARVQATGGSRLRRALLDV